MTRLARRMLGCECPYSPGPHSKSENTDSLCHSDTNKVVGVMVGSPHAPFISFFPSANTGPQGDNRVEGYIVILRAVVTTDYMTAEAFKFDMDLLTQISTRIVNEVSGVSAVMYNTTSKPPATIELQ